jgi:hypothetical protein
VIGAERGVIGTRGAVSLAPLEAGNGSIWGSGRAVRAG